MKRREIRVIVDRKIGSSHPNYPSLVYEVNYGYVPGVLSNDLEEQDAYIIGIDVPIEEFIGDLVAIIQREDDIETKWVVVPKGTDVSIEEIRNKTNFVEKYFKINILKL